MNTYRSKIQVTITLSLIHTLYNSLQHTLILLTLLCSPVTVSQLTKFKVKVTLRLTVGQSVCLGVYPYLRLMTRYLLLFDSYGLIFMGRSLWRDDGCLLYMLLALASEVFLGSESLGTRDHILLSQFCDFPFRRLLRLARSRCRYSTPPPHGVAN
jgi:hypothetical protein